MTESPNRPVDCTVGLPGASSAPLLSPHLDRGNPLSTFTAEIVDSLPGPSWLRASRQAAWARFATLRLPSSEQEEWRYSRIGELDLDRYHPWVIEEGTPGVPTALTALVEGLAAAVVVVVRNGAVVSVDGRATGVTVGFAQPGGSQSGDPQPDDPQPDDPAGPSRSAPSLVPGALSGEPDALTTLNAALCHPLTVDVDPGVRIGGPVVIVQVADCEGTAVFPRTLLRVGSTAEVTVVEIAWSPDLDILTVPVTEIDVADGAHVRYVHLQELGAPVWQTGLQASRVGRDATLASVAVALGGDYTRLRTDSVLVEPGGTTELLAVYFGTGGRMVDFRTTQHHRAPRTTSRLLYKGAVANRSRAVYSGLIRVEKGARGTNAFQTNRNLVLHEGAHAESVPNLEIEDNDVRCSHASAVGPISEDQRFYLESRGVPAAVAERLVTLGFLREVLDQVGIPAVTEAVSAQLASMLDRAERAEADAAVGAGR